MAPRSTSLTLPVLSWRAGARPAAPRRSASRRRPFSRRGKGGRDPQTRRGRRSAKAEEALLKQCRRLLGLLSALQPCRAWLRAQGAARAPSKQPVPLHAPASGTILPAAPSHSTAALGLFLPTEQKGKTSFSWHAGRAIPVLARWSLGCQSICETLLLPPHGAWMPAAAAALSPPSQCRGAASSEGTHAALATSSLGRAGGLGRRAALAASAALAQSPSRDTGLAKP